MKKKIYFLITTIIIVSLAIFGCGKKTNNEENNKEPKNGEQRVVATSVAVTEIIDALGVPLVGVPTSSYTLPSSTEGATKIGNPMNPDLEIIKSLKPSVVVSVDTLGEDYKNIFKENNIPSEFITLTSVSGLKESIERLGVLFNKEDKAKEILTNLNNKEKEVANISEGKDKEKVLIVFAAPGSMMLATSKSYIGNLLDIVSGENIIKDNKLPFVTYNKEEISKLDPDKVLVMTHANPEETKKMVKEKFSTEEQWKNIKAIKEGKVTYLDSEYFGMSANLKVMEALDKLSEIVYGNEESND